MKWSIYNEVIPDTEDKKIIYLFNYFRNKLVTLDKRLECHIRNNSDTPIRIFDVHPELYKTLLEEKLIIADEIDEIKECVGEVERKFAANDSVRVTVNPTLDCNLRCWYCYENHEKGSVMSVAVIKNTIKFLEKTVSSPTLKKVQISFFGGEPLLKYHKVVKPLITSCHDICEKNGKIMTIGFTTNGVCLTPEVVNDLKKLSSDISVQVAFDGGKKYHDQVKCFPSGLGSYDIVRDNLINAIQHGILTTVRCNYTLDNLDSFITLVDDFKEYWEYPNVRFAFHKVWQEPQTSELNSQIQQMRNKMSRMKIQSNVDSFLGDSISPCYGDFDNNYVVNYNGDVYKCTARDFRPENRIGYLSAIGDIILNDIAVSRSKRRFTTQCYSCRLLPICTICSQQRFESTDSTCPIPIARENADENIRKYFYDILNLQKQSL